MRTGKTSNTDSFHAVIVNMVNTPSFTSIHSALEMRYQKTTCWESKKKACPYDIVIKWLK